MRKLFVFIGVVFIFIEQISTFDTLMPENEFNKFLSEGSMDGYYTYEEFWNKWFQFRNDTQNSVFLSDRISIGKTFEDREIYGYYLTDDVSKLEDYKKTKNIVLLDSLHHSREPITLTMMVLLMREVLKLLRTKTHSKIKEFFRDNIIFVVPILNVDSYVYINNHYNTSQKNEVKMIRKNRHIDPRCNEITGGVDLNRNYEFKFAFDNEGSSPNPCAEDYRGQTAFSEPETVAIKNYVIDHSNLVSSINFHSYGNAWVYPFGFVSDKSNHLLEEKNLLFKNFLDEFKKDIEAKKIKALFGNTPLLLDYSCNGEAGDWFVGKKDVLGIDFELGDLNNLSESFYPPQSIISDIVRYNWHIVKEFIYHHIIAFSHRMVYNKNKVSFEIINKSLSSLYAQDLKIEPKFTDKIDKTMYKIEYCIKTILTDSCSLIPILSDNINTIIKGRHVLEITITFQNVEHVQLLSGLKLVIHRAEKYMHYGNQLYFFKSK